MKAELIEKLEKSLNSEIIFENFLLLFEACTDDEIEGFLDDLIENLLRENRLKVLFEKGDFAGEENLKILEELHKTSSMSFLSILKNLLIV